ncbi:integral membrane protein DUF92-domain-containing protein [Jimgerdemannia flammicorona]|uniref:Integral membrane protein DUF92-domain-containing protein n=1 Tax=Jimgerdemannia flammicorona TaxID=994334 RepID=A0A433QLX0_9FUNG|nr:integral membrane protein DUF92-domain-containing protein [Jimgerdemannia flammicorona]
MHILLTLACAVGLVVYSLRKKSLSPSGAAGAFALALITFSAHLFAFTAALMVFFLTSSKLTKFKADRKRQLEDSYLEGGQRDIIQVLCNGLTAAVVLVVYRVWFGNGELACFEDERWARALVWAYVGHYAACNGDTVGPSSLYFPSSHFLITSPFPPLPTQWSSELGILNTQPPYLITTFRQVPPGTNGAVSPLGLVASLVGGLVVGASAALVLAMETPCSGYGELALVIVGAVGGLGGSLVGCGWVWLCGCEWTRHLINHSNNTQFDSILGATIEQTLYSPTKGKIVSGHHSPTSTEETDDELKVVSGLNLLSGNQINFLSSLVTAVVAGAAAWWSY